jgi:hypothetical protein
MKWDTSAAGWSVLGDSINIIKKNTEILVDPSKEICLEVNAEKTVCSCLIT